MKLISEYMSENGERTAKVYVNEEERNFVVSFKDVFGVHYTTKFTKLQSAEDSAEDYVL